ncbi:MAG: dihydrodipicolinate synthase family protein [Thermoguttaceae bacterium]
MPLPKPLCGIVPPMVTPLADRDTLDTDGTHRLVEHILAAGPAGLFILGTTGEGPSLSYHLRRQLVDLVCQIVDRRVPVLVGVTDSAFIESINMAEEAAEAGADAVVLSAPFYFKPGQEDLWHYLRALVKELPLPVFLYNMPSHTKVAFSVDTVRRALELPGVVGVKDSSGDMIYFDQLRQVVAERPDFSLLVGPEELLAEAVLLGAHGGVSGGANLWPELYVELHKAASAGDLRRAGELHRTVTRLASSIYHVGPPGASVLQGIKTALSILGICSDLPAEPFRRLGQAQRDEIERAVGGLGLIDKASLDARKG